MSYDIDTWRVKSFDGLLVPLKAVHDLSCTTVLLEREGKVKAEGLSEGFELVGRLVGDSIEVEHISTEGEGSGHTWDEFKALLNKSKGVLIAVQVWEGGDSITKLTVKDGSVVEEEVEL